MCQASGAPQGGSSVEDSSAKRLAHPLSNLAAALWSPSGTSGPRAEGVGGYPLSFITESLELPPQPTVT